jgi:hypothetical protein
MRKSALALAALASTLVAGVAAALPPPPPPPPLFENAASRGLVGVQGMQVAFADLDGDGWPDVVADKTKVYYNRPSPEGGRTFVHAEHDLAEPRAARGFDSVQFGDVNNDGHLDAFFGRRTDLSNEKFKDDGLRNEIWLEGKRKVEKSGVDEHAETTQTACFVDYDRDGVLDLLVGNDYVAYGKGFEAFPTRLYHGNGDGTFVDVTEKAGMLGIAEVGKPNSRRPCYGVTHTDWNNDGWQDLLICTYGRQLNRLWKNNGDGTFTDVGDVTHFDGDDDRTGKYTDEVKKKLGMQDEPPWRSNGNNFDAAVADYDGDGNMDVFLACITHWWAGPSSDLSSLLINQGPEKGFVFTRRPEMITRPHEGEHWNQGDLHAGWLDVDNDGLLDLVIASSDYPDEQILRLYHQRPDHTFEDWTDRLGFKWINASHISFGDFDGDGATDILVGTSNVRLTPEQVKVHSLDIGLWRNTCAAAAGNTFLNVRLVGGGKGKANRDAIGARVILWIDGKRQTREVQGGLGCGGHRDDTDCRFGVGKAKTVDKLEVHWPDAAQSVQVFTNVPTGKFYVLEQGGTLREGRSPKVWR